MKQARMAKVLLIGLSFMCLLWVQNSFANDTDIYLSSGQGVEPNILIIFDNSGSMGDLVPAPPYNKDSVYATLLANMDPPIVPQVSAANWHVVYSCTTSGSCTTVYASDISQVQCNAAKTALTNSGYYQGRLKSNSACGTWTDKSYTLRTGNYLDYLQFKTTDSTYNKTKIQVAKDVVNDFVTNIEGVKAGIMIFNDNQGGRIQNNVVSVDTDTAKTQLHDSINAIDASGYTPLAETLYEAGLYYKGGNSFFNHGVVYTSPIEYKCQRNYVIIITDGDSTKDRDPVLKTITNGFSGKSNGDMDGDGWEPGLKNEKIYYDCSGCSPSCAYPNCPNNNGCCNNLDGSDYLDDVANYLFQTDLRSGSNFDGTQNIITYTIGFTVSSQWNLLERTAQYGHGKYYFCENAQDLAASFQNVISEILNKTSSFVAPIIPVSQVEKSSAGDKIYLALFKPQLDGMWKGNIKKFGIAQPNGVASDCPYNSSYQVGDILDATCKEALDPSNGQFYDTAKSYWVTMYYDNDGGEVENGGVGEILKDQVGDDCSTFDPVHGKPRQIYTYLGSKVDLTDSSNRFYSANIPPGMLGLASGDTAGRDQLISYIYGYDAYGTLPCQRRDWVLGAFLHSRPYIITYDSSTSVVYGGSNDGMLHAFDASSGKELWAFIPPCLLTTLQAVHLDVNQIFVDGSPKAYVKMDSYGNIGGMGTQAILIFGLRRGGNHYIALDVTTPTAPKFLWDISPSAIVTQSGTTNTNTYQELGQTWSNPKIGNIDDGTPSGKPVFFIGGGYDPYEDNSNPDPATNLNPVGRAVYIVSVLDGSLVKRFSYSDGYSSMIYSIPSDVTLVDTDGNGKIDRLYVGDMGGQMWRFDVKGSNSGNWSGKILFKSNPGIDSSTGRKIFYSPDVSLETENKVVSGLPTTSNYEMVYFGTGDREHPKNTNVVDRLYAIKDRNPDQPVTESADQIVDVTQDLLQEPGTSLDTFNAIMSNLKNLNGWFIKLNQNSGEKSLSSPVIFFGVVYYTTFTPTSTDSNPVDDPCYVGEGQGRVYVVDYFSGNAVFDFDITNDVTAYDPQLNTNRLYNLRRNDRVENNPNITGILSEPIITFIHGIAVGYAGVSAGIQKITLPNTKSFVPIYWYSK